MLRGIRSDDFLAGSAYTYAYATLGRNLFARMIGWDLTLEYAMERAMPLSGWSNHFIELLNIFQIKMPLWLAYDHWTGLWRSTENRGAADGQGCRPFTGSGDPGISR